MNSLIIVQEKHYAWLRDAQLAEHPAMATVCNKPLLEYLVDFVILLGCKNVRLVLEEPDEAVTRYFGHGERWGIAISYGNSRAADSLEKIVEKNGNFNQPDHLIIIDGLLFLHYDKNSSYEITAPKSGFPPLYAGDAGSISCRLEGDPARQVSAMALHQDLPVSAPRSSLDIFTLTMRIIRDEQHQYVLPGYGSEKGVILGRNVEIGRNVIIQEPVVVGSNVRFLGKAVIGPNAVIGNHVIVDDGAEVRDSIVLENTYIGRRLFISGKLVTGNRVLSVENGQSIQVSDGFFLSPIKGAMPGRFRRYAAGFCGAALLALLQAVPFCVIWIIQRMRGFGCMEKRSFLLASSEGVRASLLNVLQQSSKTACLIRWMALDRFTLLKYVFSGKVQLVGNQLVPDTEEGRAFVQDFPGYMPGIFNYSEADRLEPGTAESEIAERYYSAHRGFFLDVKTLLKILTNSLLPDNK